MKFLDYFPLYLRRAIAGRDGMYTLSAWEMAVKILKNVYRPIAFNAPSVLKDLALLLNKVEPLFEESYNRYASAKVADGNSLFDIEYFGNQIDAVISNISSRYNTADLNTAMLLQKNNERLQNASNETLEATQAFKNQKLFTDNLFLEIHLINDILDKLQPMTVQITSTQTVEIAKSEANPNEMVAVATIAKDSTNQVVSAQDLPRTQTGEIATTKAMDEATGNVVEIVTDKQNLPITKTAVVEDTTTGAQQTQALAVNAQGQPVATVVTDSKGEVKTMIDPVSKQEMPVVNTATVPQAIQQAVSSPTNVARVETDGTPVATTTPQENHKPNLTKAGVIFGVCTVLAVVGYSILK
jgi:hypothetical protein